MFIPYSNNNFNSLFLYTIIICYLCIISSYFLMSYSHQLFTQININFDQWKKINTEYIYNFNKINMIYHKINTETNFINYYKIPNNFDNTLTSDEEYTTLTSDEEYTTLTSDEDDFSVTSDEDDISVTFEEENDILLIVEDNTLTSDEDDISVTFEEKNDILIIEEDNNIIENE
jgi:hypothetical protein